MKNKLNNVVVFNFSKIYEDEDFWDDVKNPRFIDVSDISGTRGICDDIAISKKKKRISVIQDETNEKFFNLIRKSQTFGGINITEDYEVRLFDEDGRPASSSASAS